MHYLPWDEWIVLALFLVGIGGGGFFYSYFLWLKAEKTLDASLKKALIFMPFITLVGLLVLLIDLGRPERFLNAVFHFNPHSILNMGVFVQGAFVTVALLIVLLIYLKKTQTKLFELSMHFGMAFGLLICLYHGLLPVSMPRDGWSGALVFVMFFSSVLSGRAFVEYLTHVKHSSPSFNLIMLLSFWATFGLWIYTLSIGTTGERLVLTFLFSQWSLSAILLVALLVSALVASLFLVREFFTKAHPSHTLLLAGIAIEFFGAFMLKYGVILAGQLSFLTR